MRGVCRWAWHELRHHLGGFGLGTVLLGIVAVIVDDMLRLPPRPTFDQYLTNGLFSLAIAVGGVVVLGGLGLLALAPYQQRNALRKMIPGDVDSLIADLRQQRVTVCGEHTVGLDEVCLRMAPVLTLWARDWVVWVNLEQAFPCPESGLRQEITHVVGLLHARGLIDEERHRHMTSPAPAPANISSTLAIYGARHVSQDDSFSEFRWTALGQAVANRLVAEASRS
jgi:hypothetical protein